MEEVLDTLDSLDSDQELKIDKPFAYGVGASVAFHLICALLLIGLPQGPQSRQSVTYIDLSLPQSQAPSTFVPATKEAPVTVPKVQKPEVMAEKEIVPDTPPKPQEAEGPKAVPQQQQAAQETRPEEQRSATTLGLGLTRGYFRSLAEGESLRPAVKDYFLEMLEGINKKWWMDQHFDSKSIAPLVVNIVVARNGEIVGSEVMISSGNYRYDRAVLAAIKAASPLPPLPASYQGEYFQAPLRLVPPLNLMTW